MCECLGRSLDFSYAHASGCINAPNEFLTTLNSDFGCRCASTSEQAIVVADREIRSLTAYLADKADIQRSLAAENAEILSKLEQAAQRCGSAEQRARRLELEVQALQQRAGAADARAYELTCIVEQLKSQVAERDRAIADLKTAQASLLQELALFRAIGGSEAAGQRKPAPETALAEDRLRNAELQNSELKGYLEQYLEEHRQIPQLELEIRQLRELNDELSAKMRQNAISSEELSARLSSEAYAERTAAQKREDELYRTIAALRAENETLQQSRLCVQIQGLHSELDELRALNAEQQKAIRSRDAALRESYRVQADLAKELKSRNERLRAEEQDCHTGEPAKHLACALVALQSELAEQRAYARGKQAQIEYLQQEIARQRLYHGSVERYLGALQGRLLVRDQTAHAYTAARQRLSEALEREKRLLATLDRQNGEIYQLRGRGSAFVHQSYLLLERLRASVFYMQPGAEGPCRD